KKLEILKSIQNKEAEISKLSDKVDDEEQKIKNEIDRNKIRLEVLNLRKAIKKLEEPSKEASEEPSKKSIPELKEIMKNLTERCEKSLNELEGVMSQEDWRNKETINNIENHFKFVLGKKFSLF